MKSLARSALPLPVNSASLHYDGKSLRQDELEGLPFVAAPHGARRIPSRAGTLRLSDRVPAARFHASTGSSQPRGSSRRRICGGRARRSSSNRRSACQYSRPQRDGTALGGGGQPQGSRKPHTSASRREGNFELRRSSRTTAPRAPVSGLRRFLGASHSSFAIRRLDSEFDSGTPVARKFAHRAKPPRTGSTQRAA